MSNTRRGFIKRGAGVVGASLLGTAGFEALQSPFVWTQDKTTVSRDRPTLVVIYLRGGADPLNVIVPYRDKDYYAVRPTIAIPRPGEKKLMEGERACIPLSPLFGLHPALAPLYPLWKQKQLAPIVNVGSPHETRSHFDAQDFMERAAPGIKSISEGWLNRYLGQTADANDHFLRGFSPQPLLPRALRGEYSVLAAPRSGSERALDTFERLYKRPKSIQGAESGDDDPRTGADEQSDKKRDRKRDRKQLPPAKPAVTEQDLSRKIHIAGVNTVEKLRHLNKILGPDRGRKKNRGYPRGTLGRQLADVAAVIKARQPLEIAALDYNGWDHHSSQGGSSGQMARMLGQVASAIHAFVTDLGPARMAKVTILTMSEFGRTVAENGTEGSDHGHGGFMLAMGGLVNGGKVYGKWTGLSPSRLYRKRDLPVTTDFRDVFAETLHQLYRFDTNGPDFFPGFKTPLKKPLGCFKAYNPGE